MTTLDDLRNKRISVPVHHPDILRMSGGQVSIDERINHPRITELIWGRDYYVRMIPLPRNIAGVSSALPDGTYNIYVNERLSVELQWDAFLHELLHCEAGHFDEWKDLPIEVKEWEAEHLRPVVMGK